MFTRRISTNLMKYLKLQQTSKILKTQLPCNSCKKFSSTSDEKPLGSVASKYKVFCDQDADIIFDSEEERYQYPGIIGNSDWHPNDEFEGLNLQHGEHGVFDVHDLVKLLRRENAQDIVVCQVPADLKYVDYITIVSGKSTRHMQAIAQFVRKIYKRKSNPGEILPKIEGKDSKEWMALDLGNIALHIFSSKARKRYDIDMLWAVGPEFDSEYNKPQDPITELLERHTTYLNDLTPKSVSN